MRPWGLRATFSPRFRRLPILDQFGRPMPASPPTRPAAEVEITGVRRDDYDSVARGLTPSRLAGILDNAAVGDMEEYLTMCEEFEERDPHFSAVVGTRKLAVTGAPREMLPYDDSARAELLADAFREHVMETPQFSGMLFDLLDSLVKGFAAVQPVWDTSVRPWRFKAFVYTDPRWFTLNQNNLREFRLKSERSPDGERLPNGRFVFHFPQIKSGLPIRGGLGRLCAISLMLKAYTLKDWAAFMEVFGMPIRLGKYNKDTITDREKATLLNALRNLGHDAAAMLPEDMTIELVDAKRPSGGDSLFGGLADYLDKQLSKGVLGQTMTTDDGSSLSQASVHQQVRQDILDADARALEATINEFVVKPWVLYNFGEPALKLAPKFRFQTDPPEDHKAWTEAVLPWVAAGMKVEASVPRERFGIPDPEEREGAEILGGTEAAPEEPEAGGEGQPEGQQAREVAENATEIPANLQRTETQPAVAATQFERVLGPYRDAIEEIAEGSEDYEDFLRRLNEAKGDFDGDMFVRRLAVEMAKVRGLANA